MGKDGKPDRGHVESTPTLQLFCRGALTVRNFIRPLPLLVHNNDHHENDDFSQNSQERPERGQVAAYPEDGDGGVSANGVGGITFVFTRVFCDLEVHDAQLRVVLFADDEEAARGVDNILLGARRVRTHRRVREAEPGPRDAVRSQQDTGWDK